MPFDLNQAQKLLIVKLSSIGDIVHALPVAVAFKRSFPHLHLGWVVEDRNRQVVQGTSCIDELIVIPHKKRKQGGLRHLWREFRPIIRDLRAKKYEIAIDLQGLFKSGLWAWLSGARVRLGAHRMREGTKYLLKRVPSRPTSVHVVDQYLDAAHWLGAQVEPVEFPLHISEEARQSAVGLLRGLGADAPFISLNPSAGRDWKRWHIARFAELTDRIEQEMGFPTVFVGGPGDKLLHEQLQNLKQRPLRSLIGRTNLKEVMAIVERSSVHVCGDTGTAHVAAALKIPCVSIFGPTDPDRTGPYGQREHVLCKRSECMRCRRNDYPHDDCMHLVSVDEVYGMVRSVVNAV
jgi:heptosyltransferase-1